MTATELVIANSALAGAKHYEIRRKRSGETTTTQIFPGTIPAATPSLADRGQGLVAPTAPYETDAACAYPRLGFGYEYTLTVETVGNVRRDYPATAVDVVYPTVSRGATLCLGFVFAPYYGLFPWPPYFSGYPAPVNRLYAKHIGTARDPQNGAALACAQVTVKNMKTGQPAVLYADRHGLFRHPNPMSADRNGRFEFYVENGLYALEVAGASSYAQTDVTIYDARALGEAQATDDAALKLVTSADRPATPSGNIPLQFTRPGGFDFNNLNVPHRILAHDSVNAWALTYNAGWDEASSTWVPDDLVLPSLFFRINKQSRALEYGVDQSIGSTAAAPCTPPFNMNWCPRQSRFETLVHIGPDRAHVKALGSPVVIPAIAAENGIGRVTVVVMQSDGRVRRTQGREMNPYVVVIEDEGNVVAGAPVYLGISGQGEVYVQSGSYDIGTPFVSGPGGVAVPADDETDARYILGYAQAKGGGSGQSWTTIGVR